MALNCGMNVLPAVLTVSGWALSWSAVSASNQALSNADAKARHIAASWGFNYPCPEECNYQTIGIKTMPLPPRITVIHLWFWTFYLATVTLNFQPIIYCTQIP